jgi:large subunit ribosomal protein L31
MKAKIHPRWHQTQVKCACGNAFTTCSTRATLAVEICSACHPFYTGKQRAVAREGQVEKFHQRVAAAAKDKAAKAAKK